MTGNPFSVSTRAPSARQDGAVVLTPAKGSAVALTAAQAISLGRDVVRAAYAVQRPGASRLEPKLGEVWVLLMDDFAREPWVFDGRHYTHGDRRLLPADERIMAGWLVWTPQDLVPSPARALRRAVDVDETLRERDR